MFQMMMARRMMRQRNGGGQVNAAGPAAAGCGCLSSIVGLVVTAAVLYGGFRIYDSTMNVVDDAMEDVDAMVDESLEEINSGDVSGIGYDGSYSCEATGAGATATLEVTNTDTVEHSFDLTWQLFAVPTDVDVDITDLGNLGEQFSGDALLEQISDTFVLAPGESTTKTYDAPDVEDDNVGCGPPVLFTDLAAPAVPDVSIPEVELPS